MWQILLKIPLIQIAIGEHCGDQKKMKREFKEIKRELKKKIQIPLHTNRYWGTYSLRKKRGEKLKREFKKIQKR